MTMTTDRDARRDSSTETVVFMDEPHSFVDWGATLGGAILATAVATLLLVFGSALGLSLTSAYPGRGLPATGLVIAGAVMGPVGGGVLLLRGRVLGWPPPAAHKSGGDAP